MKKLIIILAVTSLSLGTPACETTGVFPFVTTKTNVAVSTYTVQGAEKALKQFKLTVDLFAGLVKDNHAFVVAHLPSVYAFAQKVQVEAPGILQKADAAKNNFKHNRTPDGQTTLNQAMATLMELQNDVLNNTNQVKAAIGTP